MVQDAYQSTLVGRKVLRPSLNCLALDARYRSTVGAIQEAMSTAYICRDSLRIVAPVFPSPSGDTADGRQPVDAKVNCRGATTSRRSRTQPSMLVISTVREPRREARPSRVSRKFGPSCRKEEDSCIPAPSRAARGQSARWSGVRCTHQKCSTWEHFCRRTTCEKVVSSRDT